MTEVDCIADDVLVDLIEQRLPEGIRASVHRHAAVCATCRTLIAAVVRGAVPASVEPAAGEPAAALSPGVQPMAEVVRGPAALAWAPPGAFAEFRLVCLLGRGGMGVVYLAHDLSLERLVAIKFIASSRPAAPADFTTEARALARVQHPNVVAVFRVGEVEGHPYLVSEYMLGRSLAAIERPMAWRRLLRVGIGIARGLAAAHRHGVLHRDLKPSNVLVSHRGEVKLLDFGLAHLLDGRDTPVSATPPRTVVGTPRYMAPEVRRGDAATVQSDIYALGLVLYELCTGRLPPADSAVVIPGAATEGLLPPDIDPDFIAILARCLDRTPAERFVSAEVLGDALEQLDRCLTLPPLPAGNPYRGLLPFEAEHRALFFGRDGDVRAVLDRLQGAPLLVVTGDSGVGKSSLCRAGIVPRIVAGALDDGRTFTAVTLCPGRAPLASLAEALGPVLQHNAAVLQTRLRDDPAWLGQGLRDTCRDKQGLVLLIDQLEELLTHSEPADVRTFVALVDELARPTPGVRTVLVVRGDFLTRVLSLLAVGRYAEPELYLLRPLLPAGVREAIVGPARSQGVVFESEALITQLVESTTQHTGSLPLLQFVLAELWDRRDLQTGRMTQAALDAMGSVAGALSRHADSVLGQLDAASLQAARRILVRLVAAQGTRIQRSEAELGGDDALARGAMRVLIAGRVLQVGVAGGSTTYQIAHDALIERWDTLRNWIAEDLGQRAIRQRVETASSEWERLGRASEALWGVRQLREALPLDPGTLAPREQAFLSASRRALRRRRILLLAPLLLAAGYGGVRLSQHRETMRDIAGRLAEVQKAIDTGQRQAEEAEKRRAEALALFDMPERPQSEDEAHKHWDEAERCWAEALEAREGRHVMSFHQGMHTAGDTCPVAPYEAKRKPRARK